jgi:hypothetical protein
MNLVNMCPTVQEYAAKSTAELRTVLLWVVTQQVVAIPYRRFVTAYQSHLQQFFLFLDP